jgi:toxin YoeB
VFLPEAWADYIYWQGQDKKTLRKINQLLQDISRDNFVGIGKPEPLKGDMAGWWSRRIDDENRLVYSPLKIHPLLPHQPGDHNLPSLDVLRFA